MSKNTYGIETAKDDRTKKPYHWVRYYGRNGQILATSESVKSLGSARINIAAIIELADVMREIPMIKTLLAQRKAKRDAAKKKK